MAPFVVVLGALLALALLGALQPVTAWWAALRARPGPSSALILAMATTFLGGVGGPSSGDIMNAASGIRAARIVALLTLLLVAAGSLVKHPDAFARAGSASRWMTGYALFAMGSALYSVSPFVSLWKGFEVFVFVISGFYLSVHLRSLRDVQWLLDVLWLILLFLVLTALAGAVVVPSRAFAKLELSSSIVIAGVYPVINSNSLTQFAALLAVVLLIRVLQPSRASSRLSTLVVFGIAVTAMLLAHSRTSIFAGLVAVLGVVYFAGRRTLFGVLAATSALLWVFSEIVVNYLSRGQSREVFMSLSGRTYFWEGVWAQFLESPIVGHGFYAANRDMIGVSSVDNTYLDVLVGIGIVGLVLLLLPVLLTLLGLARTRPSAGHWSTALGVWLQLFALAVLLVVRSLTGPSFHVMHPNLVMFTVLIVSVAVLACMKVPPANASERPARRTRRVYPSLLR